MKTKFGHMPCRDCGTQVVVRIDSETGTLSYSCDECTDNGYCKKTQDNYSTWLKRIKPIAGAPAPAPEKKPAAEPAKKPSSSTIV